MLKPILFNGQMVEAIIRGYKTQTRRLIKPKNPNIYDVEGPAYTDEKGKELTEEQARLMQYWEFKWGVCQGGYCMDGSEVIKAPYCPGDVLWVRETWKPATTGMAGAGLIDTYLYRADGEEVPEGYMADGRWHPAIYMPERVARIFLRVNHVYAENLQDITNDEAMAEGASEYCCYQDENGTIVGEVTPRDIFAEIWDATLKPKDIPKYGWAANPLVWVIEFERMSKNEAFQ